MSARVLGIQIIKVTRNEAIRIKRIGRGSPITSFFFVEGIPQHRLKLTQFPFTDDFITDNHEHSVNIDALELA